MPVKKPQIVVVEIDRNDVQPAEDAENSLAGLNGHPGFEEILRRLRLHRQALRTKLEAAPLDQVVELQQGIKWVGWTENFLRNTTRMRQQHTREPFSDELSEFERIAKALTIVGTKPS